MVGQMVEQTLVIIKPDGVEKRLIGEVVKRYEAAGLRMVIMKMTILSGGFVESFYAEHRGKAFFHDLCGFMTSGPVVIMVLEGKDCIETVRAINGMTDSNAAGAGTIRGDFGDRTVIRRNVVHASDSAESARREIKLCFNC